MEDEMRDKLQYLGFKRLTETWDENIKIAGKKKCSYHRFLSDIINDEYIHRKEYRRIARLRAAKIPEMHQVYLYKIRRNHE